MNQNVLAVLLLGFAVVAQAQQSDPAQLPAVQAQQGPGSASDRGRSPRGPFEAWARDVPQPGPASPIKLANISQIQEELNLTAEQKQALADLTKKLNEQQVQLYTERMNRAQALNREADQAVQQLLDPKQLARIEQLRLQREGVNALFLPEVAEQLGLSDEQRAKLKKLQDDLRNASGFGRGSVGGGPSAASRNDSRNQILADIAAVLTHEQKAKWEAMQGPKFEFPGPTPPIGWFSSPSGTMNSTPPSSRIASLSRARAFELGQLSSGRSVQAAEEIAGPAGPFRYRSTVEALALTEDQKRQIQSIGEDDATAIQKLRDEGVFSTDKVAQISKTTREKLDKVLTEDQQAKLKQLAPTRSSFITSSRARAFELGQLAAEPRSGRQVSMQWIERLLGPAGPFRYKSTVEALALTESQKTQVQAIGVEDAKAIGKLSDERDPSEKSAQITKSTREKLDQVLTDDQKTKLKELTSQ